MSVRKTSEGKLGTHRGRGSGLEPVNGLAVLMGKGLFGSKIPEGVKRGECFGVWDLSLQGIFKYRSKAWKSVEVERSRMERGLQKRL